MDCNADWVNEIIFIIYSGFLYARVDLDLVAAEQTLLQPEMMIVGHKGSQAFIITEKQVLLEVDSCSIEGQITLLASYYIFM